MRVLVTGGAGYIGSHVVRRLKDAGHEPFILDDLEEGHRFAVAEGVDLTRGDIADAAALDQAIAGRGVDGVIHMAASCLVGESMERPARYYDNNVIRTLRLLENLAARGIGKFVFSSTAAVYGDPTGVPGEANAAITEEQPCEPTNVYGETKLAVERALAWQVRGAGLKAVSLRYFNAAGADPSGDIGEDHEPETHIIPLVMRAALGLTPSVTILGRDYPTLDGTCLRDYIHVCDLAEAHLLALDALDRLEGYRAYNLGAEKATSVLELIESARRITGCGIPVTDGPRRPGDPPRLLASSARIRKELGWKPRLSDLETILGTAWSWHRRHPNGFEAAPAP
ncbi:MAG TPA: UDP-glucose 4-epimerase GalE [Patescibacteria group bacterium]|nr:UDP-glucose 4-epimerase GalE [Patescibacteria group bacterium]